MVYRNFPLITIAVLAFHHLTLFHLSVCLSVCIYQLIQKEKVKSKIGYKFYKGAILERFKLKYLKLQNRGWITAVVQCSKVSLSENMSQCEV